MGLQGMKSFFALLLTAVAGFSAGFPVFVGGSSDYLSNSTGKILFVFSNNVVVTFDRGSSSTEIGGAQDSVQLAVKATAGQSSNIFQARNWDGSDLDFALSSSAAILSAQVPLLGTANSANAIVANNDAGGGLANNRVNKSLSGINGITVHHSASAIVVSNDSPSNLSAPIQVLGVGGANTNFTFQASDKETHVDAGTTNVNIVAIMGGTSTLSWEKHIVFTNRTATSRSISFSPVTNNWIALQEYDGVTNAGPIIVTNNQAVYMWLKVRGSNVAYAYKPARNPAN